MISENNHKQIGAIVVPAFVAGKIVIRELADRNAYSTLINRLTNFGSIEPPSFFSSRESVIRKLLSNVDTFSIISMNVELCQISGSNAQLWNGEGQWRYGSNFQSKADSKKFLGITGVELGGRAFAQLDITPCFKELEPFLGKPEPPVRYHFPT